MVLLCMYLKYLFLPSILEDRILKKVSQKCCKYSVPIDPLYAGCYLVVLLVLLPAL